MTERKRWVVGFLFRDDGREVVLMEKNRPAWQVGKLNGVGGKVEVGEAPLDAMRREFLEETGASVLPWREYATLSVDEGDVYFFVALGDAIVESRTDEAVAWYEIARLPELPVIENLRWLLPLALDRDNQRTVVDYRI